MVMRRSVLPALALALALTGCGFSDASGGNADPGATPSAASSTAAPSSADAEPARNERGNIPMQVGDAVPVVRSAAPGAPPLLTLTVDKIVVDAPCQEDFQDPPENGHFVALLMRATAAADFDPKTPASFTDTDFHVIGPDGNTVPSVSDTAGDCIEFERLIHNMRIGPDQEYVGWMVLDTPVTSGALVYAPGGATTGWEWQF